MTSSTSSSSAPGSGPDAQERRWRRCFLGFLGTTAGLIVSCWLLIVLSDPFDTLHFSLPMERAPVTSNQRYAYPALARNPEFDSAVTGSSMSLLLNPEELDRDLGARFVNLSLKLGTPQEQYEILRVFTRHHERPRILVLCIDQDWMKDEGGPGFAPVFDFPAWMYDEDPWNDYAEQFSLYALRHVPWRLGQSLWGWKPRYRRDGYLRFTPDRSQYDVRRVRRKLYGKPDPTPEEIAATRAVPPTAWRAWFDFAALRKVLGLFPPETEKILFLPPLPQVHRPRLGDAKRRLVEVGHEFENVRAVDFMISSPITTTDTNYWDAVHYSVEIASLISSLFAASRAPDFESPYCQVLR